MKLDFVIAGAQKCGTTALWRFLREHPCLYLAAQKELHFFDDERIDWANPPYEAYHQHFGHAAPNKLCGEATPIYTYWPPSPARLQVYNPDIKLIVLLRDPVARAYSHWRMEVSRGADQLDFSNAIRCGRRRVIEQGEVPGHHRVFSYVERGLYAGQVARLFGLFDRAQLLFISTAMLDRDLAGTLDRVCSFLGVPAFPSCPRPERIFSLEGLALAKPNFPDVLYLRRLFAEDLAETERMIEFDIQVENIT